MLVHRQSDHLLLNACRIARVDYELAYESNHFDRMTVVVNAALLLALGIVAVIAWSAFWSTLLPPVPAILLGLLVGMIIFSIDQFIAAADWELAGVLRSKPYDRAYWWKIAFRMIIAIVFAVATATGAVLWIFGDAIEKRLQEQRVANNLPLEKEYGARKNELKNSLISPISKEIKSLQHERDALHTRIDSNLKIRNKANQQAADSRIEAGRQLYGDLPGYVAGKGSKYRDAMRQKEEATLLANTTSAELGSWQARIAVIEKSIKEKTTTLEQRQAKFDSQVRQLDAQKLNDPRWVKEYSDPLMRYIALREIKKDAKVGVAASDFHLYFSILLLSLELSFLFVKVLCAPASVLTLRMIARHKLEAAEVMAEYERKLAAIQSRRLFGDMRLAEKSANVGKSNHSDIYLLEQGRI